jgi:site-specific recombinase XerD
MIVQHLKASRITKKISLHSLRHTFATYKAERGVIPYMLREWLRHARLDTTQIYAYMARANTMTAMERRVCELRPLQRATARTHPLPREAG